MEILREVLSGQGYAAAGLVRYVGEILLPGDPEYRSAEERKRAGIPIDYTTWGRIQQADINLGLDAQDWETLD